MSQNNITLAQLQLALERVKNYNAATYSELGHTHVTSEILKLTGFVMSESGDKQNMRIALSEQDSLNEALGKLDRSIFNIVENIGAIDVENHKHDDIYYQESEIDKMFEDTIADLKQADADDLDVAKKYTDDAVAALVNSAPETLDTLKEIADSLNNDTNIYDTITNGLALKVAGPASATVDHIAVFSQADGKAIKDSGYTIETSVPSGAIFTDYKVQTTPNASAAIYFAGTSNMAGETNSLLINEKFYIQGEEDKIVAPNFEGHLAGKADEATQADTALKTQAAITIQLNGTEAGVFNGSAAKTINVTPEAIGAHAKDYTEKAADSDVEKMLTDIFGASV